MRYPITLNRRHAVAIFIPIIVALLIGGFLIGSLSRYDQIEIGKTITFSTGQVFTPETWEQAKDEHYSVLQINSKWHFPWQPKNIVKIRDGYSLISNPEMGVLYFSEGTYTINGTLNTGMNKIQGIQRESLD